MDKKKVASALAFIILAAIAAVLIIPAQAQVALAAVNDFSAYASPAITSCGCGTAEGSVTVRNTGDFENLFAITAGGDATEFVTLFPSSFVLKPGEQETVHEFVSAPCGAAKEKSYELSVGIVTDTNLQKAISQKIIVTECSNIALALSYQNNTGCRCNRFAYVFTLNNTGSYAETYRLSADGLAKNAAITPRETTLGPGNYETIRLQLSPECGQQAAYFNFLASARKSGFTASMPLRALINDSCYGVANYTEAPGKMFIPGKYAPILLYLPLVILFVLTVLFAAVTLSKAPKPKPGEKPGTKPVHYSWEHRFRAKTGKLAAGRMERAERKELFTISAALAVLVIAVAVVIVSLISSQIISFGKANISNISISNVSASNATMNVTANATGEITAANITTAANVTNFTFPAIKLPNMTAIFPSLLRSDPNSTQRRAYTAPWLPAINMTRKEAQQNATGKLQVNLTGIKNSVSSLGVKIGGLGGSIGSKLKGLTYRNDTANATAPATVKKTADAAGEGTEAKQPSNESITSSMASKAKAAASKLKSFAAAYYGYIIAGFAILLLMIIALRLAESRKGDGKE